MNTNFGLGGGVRDRSPSLAAHAFFVCVRLAILGMALVAYRMALCIYGLHCSIALLRLVIVSTAVGLRPWIARTKSRDMHVDSDLFCIADSRSSICVHMFYMHACLTAIEIRDLDATMELAQAKRLTPMMKL